MIFHDFPLCKRENQRVDIPRRRSPGLRPLRCGALRSARGGGAVSAVSGAVLQRWEGVEAVEGGLLFVVLLWTGRGCHKMQKEMVT